MSEFWLYLLRCSDDTLYTGIAVDPEQRLQVHLRGRGSKYVAGRLPACIVYREGPLERGDALRREREVKRLARADKESLVRTMSPIDSGQGPAKL